MKSCVLLFAVFFTFSITAQNFKYDEEDLEFYFEKIVPVSISKDSVLELSKEWFALNFNDSNKVIKLTTDDKIIGKASSKINIVSGSASVPATMEYSILVSFKENKYRFQVVDIYIDTGIAKNLLYDYHQGLNFDYYEQTIAASKENTTDKNALKAIDKMLSNDKMMQQTFEVARQANQNMMDQALDNCIRLEQSFYTTVTGQTKENDDW